MTSKRINTATWVEARKRWQINVQKDGVRKTFTSSTPGRTGQREANAKADEWLKSGVLSAKTTIQSLYDEFTEESREISSTAVMVHIESYGKHYIGPIIGKRKISAVCDNDIQSVLNKMAAKGLSKKTIQDCKGIIFKFLKWCRQKKYTDYRPDSVAIPAGTRYKGKRVLQPNDISLLLTCDKTFMKGKEIFEPLIYAFRFEVFTGVRPGELRGLKREDINGNSVNVKRSINGYGETTKGKNENAVRSFIMSEQAAEALQEQLKQSPNSEYLFDLPPKETYLKRWQRFCNHNGMTKISLYEMRHTFVSVVKLLPEGEVKSIVGHSQNMDTFGVYGHELLGEDEKTAQKVTGLFNMLTQGQKNNVTSITEQAQNNYMTELLNSLTADTDPQTEAEIKALVNRINELKKQQVCTKVGT